MSDLKFTDYDDLMGFTGLYPTGDKITNVINALVAVQRNQGIPGVEVSFRYNFDYGDYIEWVAAAKRFNAVEGIEGQKYKILIDEDSIVCVCRCGK